MIHIFKDEACGLINWCATRTRGGVRRCAGMNASGVKAIIQIARRQGAVLHLAIRGRFGWSVADDAGIHATPGKLTTETAEFNLRAAIHNHFKPGRFCLGGRAIMAHAKLRPKHLGANCNRLIRNAGQRICGAKHIHHINRVRDIGQLGVNRFAQQRLPGRARVHGNDAIAFGLQVFHHEIAGPVPVGRSANQRDCLHPLQDGADFRIAIGKRSRLVHGANLEECSGPSISFSMIRDPSPTPGCPHDRHYF